MRNTQDECSEWNPAAVPPEKVIPLQVVSPTILVVLVRPLNHGGILIENQGVASTNLTGSEDFLIHYQIDLFLLKQGGVFAKCGREEFG